MATTKTWQPNEKQNAFIEALKVLGKATLRQVNTYFNEKGMEQIKTGSINVLITKDYVATEKVKTPILVETKYCYADTIIVEQKKSEKEETVYSYVDPENRTTFEKANNIEPKKVEEDIEDDFEDLEDIGE